MPLSNLTLHADRHISLAQICLAGAFIILILFFSAPAIAEEAVISHQKRTHQDQEEILAETYQQLEIFSNVLSMLQENYVEEIDTPHVIKGAIMGMLQSLDPHSSYLTPEEFQDLHEETSGEFSGIGIEVTIQKNNLIIISPIARTPAAKAGLKAGDIIVAIDGEMIKEIGNYQAIEKLRGPIDSTVVISILRQGWLEPKEFSITRARIPLVSVEKESLLSGLGYVRITNFQQHTTTNLKSLLKVFTEKEQLQGLILDLRNNPGGLLKEAVEIVDTFLNQGVIVYTKGRREEQNVLFKAHHNSRHTEYPLVILINKGSASASEIVAGAIQAHKRGIIVGTQSFGKGSVQTIIPLPDGAGLRMTTAKYYTPDNQSIEGVGITPDVIISRQNQKTIRTETAAENKQLLNDRPEEQDQPVKQLMAEVEDCELQQKLSEDNQLREAYNILINLVRYTKQGEKHLQ